MARIARNSTIIAATAIHAPWVTLVANTTTSTTAVNTAPMALMAWERRIERRDPPPIPATSVCATAGSRCWRSRVCQCLTMPNWDSVKLVNTPTMYSWISRSMLASNPMISAAAALIIGFDANIDRLIQLYIVGVFTSFTLSQFGMVKHWQTLLRRHPDGAPDTVTEAGGIGGGTRRSMRRSQAINAVGAVFTAVVLVVVFATKVTHGAWIAVAAMIVLFIAMRSINRYYTRVTIEVAADDEELQTLPSRVHALVLVSRLHRPAMQAMALARGMRPDVISAVTLACLLYTSDAADE